MANFQFSIFTFQLKNLTSLAGLQLLEEIIALVINEDECGEVLNLNLPDGFHAKLGILDALERLAVGLAQGNRSQAVTDACKKHGGFYLGSIGGPAAILAQNNIKSIECVEYPELGMEAIWKIEVENFPAFILVDDKGNDFFKQLKPCEGCTILS